MKITIQIEVNEAGELMLLAHKISQVLPDRPIETALLERLVDNIKDKLSRLPAKEFKEMLTVIKSEETR